MNWHSLPTGEVLAALRSGDDGLSEAEADRRRLRYGPNLFRAATPVSPVTIFLAQLRSVLVLLLVAAAVIAALTGDQGGAGAIGAVLALNLAIGFITELRAHRAMEAVLGLEVHHARVVRDGRSREIDARELVPGDVILLEEGQAVPADARLLQSIELRTAEAALSGEPGTVSKSAVGAPPPNASIADRATMVFKTTSIVAGSARAVVVATGMDTEVGRLGDLAAAVVKERAPLERRLDSLGHRLAIVSVLAAVLIAVLGLIQGAPLGNLVQGAIALAVAAVPEGLPVVGTIAMAVGMRRMARHRVLVRHLPAVETLGSATVICTDKTGTLTAGEMTATLVRLADREVTVTGSGFAPEGQFRLDGRALDAATDPVLLEVLRIGALANAGELHQQDGAWRPVGDPTDVAFLVLALKAGVARERLVAEWPEARRVPFSSGRMWMASIHRRDGSLVEFVKGAARPVIDRCTRIAMRDGIRRLEAADRTSLLASSDDLAARGLRVLALAMGPAEREGHEFPDLTWFGFVGLSDPPAPGVPETIRTFRRAGIRTVMITGDHRLTAASVARDLGLIGSADDVREGTELDLMSDAELDVAVSGVGAFGRVSPESKLRIVAAFQRRGEIVAMLGDGVNDAAALRKADIGVVMGGRGTDLAKEAADVILEDDRFTTIGVAIEEGRVILENVRKFVVYLFSCNLAEILVLLGAGLAGHPGALPPLQLLWLNLLTDTLPALALAVEPGEPGIMLRPPPNPRAAILPAAAFRSAVAYAALIALVTLAAYAWGLRRGPVVAATLGFMTLAFAQIFHLGNARSSSPVLTPSRVMGNRYALASVALAIGLQFVATLLPPLSRALRIAPLSVTDWLVLGALGALPAVAGQTLKSLRVESPA